MDELINDLIIQNMIDFIQTNWNNISDKFKMDLQIGSNEFISGLTNKEDHIVVLLIDRQQPSIDQNYDFHEERFGINRKGQLIWGFDSGCSCPTPWVNSYPDCYEAATTKIFEIDWKRFDQTELFQTMIKAIQDIKKEIGIGM